MRGEFKKFKSDVVENTDEQESLFRIYNCYTEPMEIISNTNGDISILREKKIPYIYIYTY